MCSFDQVDRSLFSSIYDAINKGIIDSVFVIRNDKVVWANEEASLFLGLPMETMVGKYLFELIPSFQDSFFDEKNVVTFYCGESLLQTKILKTNIESDYVVILRDVSELSAFKKRRNILDNIHALNDAISRLRISRV